MLDYGTSVAKSSAHRRMLCWTVLFMKIYSSFKMFWTRFWMRLAGLGRFGRVASWLATWFIPPYHGRYQLRYMNPQGFIAASAIISHSDFSFGSNVFMGKRVVVIADGLMICDYNLSMKYNLVTEKKENKAVIYFNANLLRGAYAISLHIYHYPSAKHLVYAKNILFFSVEERFSWDGIAHLEPVLVVD